VSLIRTPQQTREDVAQWARLERGDALWAQTQQFARRVQTARQALLDFAAAGPCYVSVSWGKDSVAVAHLAETCALALPLVYVAVGDQANRDCELVAERFLRRFPAPYHRVETDAGGRHAPDRGFRQAARLLGTDRYISGVRADESRDRTIRWKRWGYATARTCAPLSDWTAREVWAYLYTHDLPVHPAYAMTFDGAVDRDDIRVASVGGQRGRGRGRQEWEQRYHRPQSRDQML
jgi:phosphoadenosine phosphosulfate reductase